MKLTGSILFLLLISLSMLTTSCNHFEETKQSALQAMAKQSSMTSYQFSGKAKLQLDPNSIAFQSPLAQELFSLLSSSEITWQGSTQLSPLSLEMDLQITPKGATQASIIPIIIQNNQLYVSLPLVNKLDEYTVFELNGDSEATTPSNPSDQLSQAPQILTNVLSLLLTPANAKWFEAIEPETSPTGIESLKKITISLSEENQTSFNEMIQKQFPEMSIVLQKTGILSESQSQVISQLQTYEWQTPSQISMKIDNEGFLREQLLEVYLKKVGNTSSDSIYSGKIEQSFTNINQPFEAKKSIPENTVLWTDILAELQ